MHQWEACLERIPVALRDPDSDCPGSTSTSTLPNSDLNLPCIAITTPTLSSKHLVLFPLQVSSIPQVYSLSKSIPFIFFFLVPSSRPARKALILSANGDNFARQDVIRHGNGGSSLQDRVLELGGVPHRHTRLFHLQIHRHWKHKAHWDVTIQLLNQKRREREGKGSVEASRRTRRTPAWKKDYLNPQIQSLDQEFLNIFGQILIELKGFEGFWVQEVQGLPLGIQKLAAIASDLRHFH